MTSSDEDDDGRSTSVTEDDARLASQAVKDFFGPSESVVSVDKNLIRVREEEILTVNGIPVALNEEDLEIKDCLLKGIVPRADLIQELLIRAGLITKSPLTQAETSAEMNLTTVKKSASRIAALKNGNVVDTRFQSTTETVNRKKSLNIGPKSEPKKASTTSSKSGESSPSIIYDSSSGEIVSGTLEELIHELVPRAHSTPSSCFQFAFLLTFRLFLTPTRLLGEVLRRADQLAHMLSVDSHPNFAENLTSLLSRWMIWFPRDFIEASMIHKVKKLEALAIERHPPVRGKLARLSTTLNSHLQALDKREKLLEKMEKKEIHEEALETGLPSLSTARELTRIELEYLCYLGPEELINAFAKESVPFVASSKKGFFDVDDNDDESVKEARLRASKKTKNLDAYIEWFNQLSYLVATSVCYRKKKKCRVKTIEYWIEVARECVELGNFNSLMGIITGLNMTPVARLKRTWLKIQSGKFAVLEHQMDPSSNFVSYRSTLKAAVSRSEGTTDQRQRVVIPFFSLLVKDLYFVNEGCSFKIKENGHFNFDKAKVLAEKLREFSKWKDIESPYERCPKATDYLMKSRILSEENLEFESYECEQPETQSEKDRYKILKSKYKNE